MVEAEELRSHLAQHYSFRAHTELIREPAGTARAPRV
jgi:hypothetical protein